MFFHIANNLFRDDEYCTSALLYEYLRKINPSFRYYEQSRDLALAKFSSLNGGKKILLRSNLDDPFNFYLQVFDALIMYPQHVNKDVWKEISNLMHKHPEFELLKANRNFNKSKEIWLDEVNKWLLKFNLRPASLSSSNVDNIFTSLSYKPAEKVEGDLITVFMSTFNAKDTLDFAISSILSQDYQNIEFIIVDDCSDDGTRDLLLSYAEKDKRITPVFNKENQGTYRNRNMGLHMAKGKYFTVMDSDDYAHPQRLTEEINAIKASPDTVAVVADWVRVSFDGRFLYKNAWQGGYQHEAVATLLIDKEKVVNQIGFYDRVRFGADSEYMQRIKKTFGENSLVLLKKPLVLASYHDASLTAHPEFGVDAVSGSSTVRKQYKKQWESWHKSTSNLHLPIDGERKFDAPKEML
jgi:hypothetical protein